MAYICEDELLNIYNSLEPKFESLGIETEVALIRDYLLKVTLSEAGNTLGKLIIDYSPKKGSHKFRRDSDLSEAEFEQILSILGEQLPEKKTDGGHKPNKTGMVPGQGTPMEEVSERYRAYVDGSFIDGMVGYGAVVLDNDTIAAEISGCVDDPEAIGSRQVGGELQAVVEVLEWCKKNSISEIAIFYDFQNIEKWATGKYRTNTPMTQAYKQYIDECRVSITWVKVASHTGVKWNEHADMLAKNGARRLEQASLFDNGPSRALSGWIVYNGSLLTPKFLEQVEWFIRSAKAENIELKPYRNDELGAAIIDGNWHLVMDSGYERPDFVIFWDKDIYLARQLERMGLRLFNSARAIYACDDKLLTHQILAGNQILMPKTIASPLVYPKGRVDEGLFIDKIEKVMSYPVVVKEAYGSFGEQVYLARDREELLALRKRLILVPHLYQEYIKSSYGRDCRLQVVGDKVVAAMLRTSAGDFRANISAGGSMTSFMPPASFINLAIQSARLVRADFAGVDMLFDEDGSPILCEINSNAHMKNIYECTGVDVVEHIIRYIKGKLLEGV